MGVFVAGLAIIFPPSMDALKDLANDIYGTGSPDKAVKAGIIVGYALLLLSQVVSTIVVSIWWQRRLGRSA